MASRRPSTRANPQGPPVTHVSDPEEILRRDKVSVTNTSRAARGATSRLRNLQALLLMKISSLTTP